jgi:glycerophosphoryl diester phosphodiesterase
MLAPVRDRVKALFAKPSAPRIAMAAVLGAALASAGAHAAQDGENQAGAAAIDLGSRPALLVDGMDAGPLKTRLGNCRMDRPERTDFSIGHRGAAARFPEHTRESYEAAARQGAGIVECDVTFTRDRELVCRHSQCDLHTTTDILEIPQLAAKCSRPFTPYDAVSGRAAGARCCTSDITLAEFRMLKGRMDTFNPRAASVNEYLGGGDTGTSRGTVMSHADSIELFKRLGVKMTPELKSPQVDMPWQGTYTRQDYARQLIDDYRRAGVAPSQVWPQSFDLADIRYWIDNEPDFARQAVYLDSRVYKDPFFVPKLADFERLKGAGVEIVAPPMFALLALDARGNIVASEYARLARAAGLGIITWTFERSDLRAGAVDDSGRTTFYYRGIGAAIEKESDMYKALDVLARDVGIKGIFSDWPATVTYYANCMGLK